MIPPPDSNPAGGAWHSEDALRTYHIDRWGGGLLGVSESGELTITPAPDSGVGAISMMEVIAEVAREGISLPVVVRFQDLLRRQVLKLCGAFAAAIEAEGYRGRFTGVFPIKVNQMREVVEDIVEAGEGYHFGLESGSKAELLAALVMNSDPEALTIVNGYKDRSYLKLAMMGRKLGRKVVVVIEKFSELGAVLDAAEEIGVRPLIGFRAKLATRGSGKWADSGGDKAKFGLTVAEILKCAALLRDRGATDCAKLFHFHIGSQVTDIRTVKDALTEGARIFAGMVAEGMPLEYFDVGGGLGVDYIGAKSDNESSINYTLKDYVEDVIGILKEVCDAGGVPHPNIVSESGRMLTACHSCVVLEVFDKRKTVQTDYPTTEVDGEHQLVKNMRAILGRIGPGYYQEAYHDALQTKADAVQAFKLGVLSLDERARAETLFWNVCLRLREQEHDVEFVPEEMHELEAAMSEQYFCNFSIFQSVPDTWAIGQVLPVVPLHRLDERPTVLSTLADITCDSDGKIDKFAAVPQPADVLPLHELDGERYFLGIFLTGAYQDVMGDLHNLFGQLNEVHIYTDEAEEGGFYIEESLPGSSAGEVLSMMQYNPKAMAADIKKRLAQLVRGGAMTPRQSVALADFYEDCLKSYTYLDLDRGADGT